MKARDAILVFVAGMAIVAGVSGRADLALVLLSSGLVVVMLVLLFDQYREDR